MKENDNDNREWVYQMRVPLKFKQELEALADRSYRSVNGLLSAIIEDYIRKNREANHGEGAN